MVRRESGLRLFPSLNIKTMPTRIYIYLILWLITITIESIILYNNRMFIVPVLIVNTFVSALIMYFSVRYWIREEDYT